MLEKEFKFYLDNQVELLKKFTGQFLVIKDQKVIGNYPAREDAYFESLEKGIEPGTFLIQECTPGEEGYTSVFHSRASF